MAEFVSGGIPVTERVKKLIADLYADMPEIEADRAVCLLLY